MMTRFTRRESFVRLMGWIGPWTAESRVPKDVVRRVVTVKPDGVHPAFESWLYRPSRRPPGGAIIIAHGLHHAGLYDHTRSVRVTDLLAMLSRLSGELRNQVAMARALVSTCYDG